MLRLLTILALAFSLISPVAGQTNLPFSSGPIAAGGGTCPQGNSYSDGCPLATSGTAQRPTILSGYTSRAPWNVAGVDYRVGRDTGTLADWQTLTSGGWSANGHTPRCQSGTVTADHIDFTLHGGADIYIPSGGCTSLTVTNSKFGTDGTGCSNFGVNDYYVIQNQGGAAVTLKYNTFDMSNGCLLGQAAMLISNAANVIFQYNYVGHFPCQVVQGPSSASTMDYRFNFIEDGGYLAGCHVNMLEWGGSVAYLSALVTFNTIYQYQNNGGSGEDIQFYGNSGGAATNPTVSNNTLIGLDTGSCQSSQAGCINSYMIHGNGAYSPTTTLSGTALAQNNYFDLRGTLGNSATNNGGFYGGSMTGWTSCSGNINMVNGQTLSGGNLGGC